MSGFKSKFKKATAEQAYIKLGIYGPSGSGKSFSSLLFSEGLAKLRNKRVAYIDTERGTDFYCKSVASRAVHPAAFDFDAIYTRSITEALEAVKDIDTDVYGVLVIDSISHLWAACIEAYSGRQTSIGSIPMHAWGKIKKPYQQLMSLYLSLPIHTIICGRQAVEYSTDEETDELKAIGVKMRAEGSTQYEPHILLRMEAIKPKRTNEIATIVAYAEKDRTGVLAGRSFVNPTFDSVIAPLLGLLGDKQARIASDDETSAIDAERIADDERRRAAKSAEILREMSARIELVSTQADLKLLGKNITPALKARMLPADLSDLRERYQAREAVLPKEGAGGNGASKPGSKKEREPEILDAEKRAMAIVQAAVDAETCDDAEYECRDEPDDVKARVRAAADLRRRELSA